MELIALIVGVIGVPIAVVRILLPWWRSESVRVRQAIRDAEPDIYFHVGGFGGNGFGYNLNIQNHKNVSAFGATIRLPSIDGPAWIIDEIPSGFSQIIQIHIADAAPIRTTLLHDARAVFEYRDRLGLLHRHTLPIQQKARADQNFNFGSTAGHVERPIVTWRDIWHLRNKA